MTYHYFVSTLPALMFGAPPPFAMEELDRHCREHLTESDLDEFTALAGRQQEQVRSDFSLEWLALETQLKSTVASRRALSRTPPIEDRPYIREYKGFRVFVENAIDDAFSRSNPLETEQAIDRLKWNCADELARTDPFGLPAVLAYYLKLEISLRWHGLSDEDGAARLEEMTRAVLTTSHEVRGWYGGAFG